MEGRRMEGRRMEGRRMEGVFLGIIVATSGNEYRLLSISLCCYSACQPLLSAHAKSSRIERTSGRGAEIGRHGPREASTNGARNDVSRSSSNQQHLSGACLRTPLQHKR